MKISDPTPKKKRRGRPPKGAPTGKTASLSVRLEPALRQRLQASADKRHAGYITPELEERLERSFRLDDEREQIFKNLGGRQSYALFRLFARILAALETTCPGRKWADDPWMFAQAMRGMDVMLRAMAPEGDQVPPQLAHYPVEIVAHLGESLALGQLSQLAAFDANEFHFDQPARSGKPGQYFSDVFKDFPQFKHDLGSLAKRVKS